MPWYYDKHYSMKNAVNSILNRVGTNVILDYKIIFFLNYNKDMNLENKSLRAAEVARWVHVLTINPSSIWTYGQIHKGQIKLPQAVF